MAAASGNTSCSPWYGNGSPPCVSSYECARSMADTLRNCSSKLQFCSNFEKYLPIIYMVVSFLSALCCLLVFATYLFMPRLRKAGYSSKVFLNRTLMDFVIAVGHIIAGPTSFAMQGGRACMVLGVVNQFALVASNLWYVFLAVDLIRAIRNPFSFHHSYNWLINVLVLLFSFLLAAVLGVLSVLDGAGGPGTSMFFWCWVRVENGGNRSFETFFGITFALYYFWHFLFWVFSLVVIVVASCILWGHLAASSETRKFVLKQNLVYVSVLGIETLFIVTFWLAQFALVEVHFSDHAGSYFFTHSDFALAVLFACVHSLRGTIDLIVWVWTFSIGRKDLNNCIKKYKIRFSTPKEQYIPPFPPSLEDPLLTTDSGKDNLVNKALRRNAIYCINVGILDAVQRDQELCKRNRRVGSVRDPFAAAALMELDQENQRDEVALLHNDNPNYRDQVVRNIPFPASSSVLKKFSFIDLEPTIFSLLRESYGILPHTYKQSFEIKNPADIDSSLMLEKFTEGKSGSFFYFTQDFRFIIKTVTASEEKFLSKIAYEYYEHMKENEDSLIVRFFGLHKVRLAPEQRYITVVVMENIFYTSDHLKIHRRFDLKGSWVGRRSLKGRSPEQFKGTLKDLDLGEEKILIGFDQKEQLMELLRKDVAFLTRCHIMDYSLLLGIHQHGNTLDVSASAASTGFGDFPDSIEQTVLSESIQATSFEETTNVFQSPDKKSRALYSRHDTAASTYGYDLHIPWYRQDSGGLHSVSCLPPELEQSTVASKRDSMVNVGNPPVTYFFGIVDILQEYTFRKRIEHLWKTRVLRQDRHGLSAVNETEYGNRFLNFLNKIFE